MADINSDIKLVKKNGRPRKKIGRRTVFTQEVIAKLEQAFAYDCTDDEACLFAGVSPAALYNFQNRNPIFMERKRLLKNTPVLKARSKVVSELSNDAELALKYLERKRKNEFGTKVEIEAAIGGPELIERWKKRLGIDQDSLDKLPDESL